MQQRRHPRASTLQRIYAAVAAGFLAGPALAGLPAGTAGTAFAAAAQDACRQPPEPVEEVPELPWAQQWFAPERVWPLSRGQDVVVAVVDSGVDTSHPQLRDAGVLAGADLLAEPAGAHVDCESHGTAVASIIAATAVEGIGFSGLAPDAQILPIRVAEQGVDATGPDRPSQVDADTFAEAVDWAVDQEAQVINLSVVFYQDDPGIAAAIGRAVDRGVVVVAAIGPAQPEPSSAAPIPYPAAYPGVLGVGSFGLAANGTPVLTSAAGPHLDLVAPGEAVTAAAAPAGHHATWSGSSFAAPFVSATAALLLAADPDLPAGSVARQLVATGDPGPGGPDGTAYPVVNPYRALTERLADGPPLAAGPPEPEAVDPVAAARAARWERAGKLAAVVTIVAATGFALAAGGAAVWRRGHRRGWRPVPAAGSPAGDQPPEPAAGEAERQFYTVPTARDRR
jgi:type VII secretion-associated serine protease mycosin